MGLATEMGTDAEGLGGVGRGRWAGWSGGSSINPLNVDVRRRRTGRGHYGISYSVKLNRELERRGARIPWNSARSFPPVDTDFRFRREPLLARVPRPRAALLSLSLV